MQFIIHSRGWTRRVLVARAAELIRKPRKWWEHKKKNEKWKKEEEEEQRQDGHRQIAFTKHSNKSVVVRCFAFCGKWQRLRNAEIGCARAFFLYNVLDGFVSTSNWNESEVFSFPVFIIVFNVVFTLIEVNWPLCESLTRWNGTVHTNQTKRSTHKKREF